MPGHGELASLASRSYLVRPLCSLVFSPCVVFSSVSSEEFVAFHPNPWSDFLFVCCFASSSSDFLLLLIMNNNN